MEWIKIKDKLPQELGLFLIINQGMPEVVWMIENIYNNKSEFLFNNGHERIPFDHITYWMKIPELPK